jgi:hypothetical protein
MMPPGIYSGFISHWSLDKKKKKKAKTHPVSFWWDGQQQWWRLGKVNASGIISRQSA